MKLFVVADIHGFFNEMKAALDAQGFDPTNPHHYLILCGDLLDRGPQPEECLDYVLSLPRAIFIRGNHEDLMEDAIRRGYFLNHDETNGTAATAKMLTNATDEIDVLIRMKSHQKYNAYIRRCVNYFQTPHYVFVHGWIPCFTRKKMSMYRDQVAYIPMEDDWHMAGKRLWEAARWYNGMDAWGWGIKVPDHTVVCGHWHTSWGHHYIHHTSEEWPQSNKEADFSPFIDDGIIALDACTAFTHKVNCIVLEDSIYGMY